MTERRLTISGLYREGWHPLPSRRQVPLLPLAGEWLAEAGFCVGARVRVEVVEPGRLVVTHVDEAGEELAPLRPLVWIGAEELGRLAAAPAAACAPVGVGRG